MNRRAFITGAAALAAYAALPKTLRGQMQVIKHKAAAPGGNIAYVNSNSGYDGGPIALTGATAGNLIIASITGTSALDTTALPAGWQKLTPRTRGAGGTETSVFGCIWYYPNWGGGNVSAAITNAPGDPGWSIHEVSGALTSNVLDDEDMNTVIAGTPTTGSLTTATNGEYIYVVFAQEQASDATLNFTSPAVRRTLQSDHVHATGELVAGNAGSYTVAGSGASHDYLIMWASFKAA